MIPYKPETLFCFRAPWHLLPKRKKKLTVNAEFLWDGLRLWAATFCSPREHELNFNVTTHFSHHYIPQRSESKELKSVPAPSRLIQFTPSCFPFPMSNINVFVLTFEVQQISIALFLWCRGDLLYMYVSSACNEKYYSHENTDIYAHI